MRFKDFLKRKKAREEPSGKQIPQSPPISLRPSIWQYWRRGDYTLQNSEMIFAAVTRISNALSAMPIQLYQNTKFVENEINDLLKYEPNPNMTSSNFFKTMEACRCTYGNCYALKVLDVDMQIVRLDVLDPSRVTPIFNDTDGELWYRIQAENKKELIVHSWYVIHVPFISTNGYIGVNPVSVLLNTLQYADDIKHYSRDQLEKGINAAVVLEAPAQLGEQQRKDTVEKFIEVYKETGGNILLLESGVTAKALNLSPVDNKLFEVEKITRSKVAMVYNIPPNMLGDYSDSKFSTMEQQNLEFLTLTMLPIVTAYEQELTRKLVPLEERKRGVHFRINIKAMQRADAKTTAEVNASAIRSGYRSPNDIRSDNGEPEIESGDTYFVSRDLLPLEFVVKNPEGILKNGATSAGKEGENDEQDKEKS